MAIRDLGNPKYISLRTFRKNGTAVDTPVWAVEEDEKLYVWTQADSWKVKRIRNNEAVQIALCDMKGMVEGEWMDARAYVDDNPVEEKKMRGRLAKKYGLMYRLFGIFGNILRRGKKSIVIVIQDV